MNPIRRGVSLVEILVVIGIIGLLLAILIPAVQRSREAARKTTCQNNLRQQALAVLSFESTNGVLPSLYNGTFLGWPRPIGAQFHFHSWRTAILPQLGLNSLYQKIDQSRPATVVSNIENLNVRVALFECPSTSNPTETVPGMIEPGIRAWSDGNFPGPMLVAAAACTDYEPVGGFRFSPIPSDAPQAGELWGVRFGVWGEPRYEPDDFNMRVGCRVARFHDVSDGLSNTLLISELAGRPDGYVNGSLVDEYPPDNLQGSIKGGMLPHATAWGISANFAFLVGYQGVNRENDSGFYSFHPSGANAAFVDGSVKFLSEQTSTEILAAMSTRAGGDVVNHQ